MPQMGPSLFTPAVKILLILNFAVFLVAVLFPSLRSFIYAWLQLDVTSLLSVLQLWRLVTYQFLHASFWHLIFNMLGLYCFGPILERQWGTRRFLPFYLGCGIAGALFYIALVAVGFLSAGGMVGASGSILGVLAACAILFPHLSIFIYFIPIPIPIRVAAFGFAILYLLAVITKGANAGGDAAHLAGMAAGALYVILQPLRNRFKLKLRAVRWEKKMTEHHKLQADVDRILQKVHDSGIHSLTSREKRILKKATKIEQLRKGIYY
jgi:membrane associated rhomboid family serine protease